MISDSSTVSPAGAAAAEDALPESMTQPAKLNLGISLLGTPLSSGNRGVLALAASLVRLLTLAAPNRPLRFLLVHREAEMRPMRVGKSVRLVPVVHGRKALRVAPAHHLLAIVAACLAWWLIPLRPVRSRLARLFPWLTALQESAFVGDIRGGDSFSDIYGLKRLVEGSIPPWTALLLRRPLVQFPQTYGPFKTRTARVVARFLLRRSAVIIARDRASRTVAEALVDRSQTVLLSPDVAFALEAIRPRSVTIEPRDDGLLASRPIGINVNGLMYRGGYDRRNMFGLKLEYPSFLTALVTRVLRETEATVLLIPHTWAPTQDVESDNQAALELRNSLPDSLRDRVRLVAAEYDAHEIKWIIGQCRFVVAARMHACIAALSQGIPAVGVAYSMKFRGVFETVGMEDWVIDGRSTGNEAALDAIMELYGRCEIARPRLAAAAERARGELFELFKRLTDGSLLGPASVSPPAVLG